VGCSDLHEIGGSSKGRSPNWGGVCGLWGGGGGGGGFFLAMGCVIYRTLARIKKSSEGTGKEGEILSVCSDEQFHHITVVSLKGKCRTVHRDGNISIRTRPERGLKKYVRLVGSCGSNTGEKLETKKRRGGAFLLEKRPGSLHVVGLEGLLLMEDSSQLDGETAAPCRGSREANART